MAGMIATMAASVGVLTACALLAAFVLPRVRHERRGGRPDPEMARAREEIRRQIDAGRGGLR